MKTELSQQIDAKKERLTAIIDERTKSISGYEEQLAQTTSAIEQARIKGVAYRTKISIEQLGDALTALENKPDLSKIDHEMKQVTRLFNKGFLSETDYIKAQQEHEAAHNQPAVQTRYTEDPNIRLRRQQYQAGLITNEEYQNFRKQYAGNLIPGSAQTTEVQVSQKTVAGEIPPISNEPVEVFNLQKLGMNEQHATVPSEEVTGDQSKKNVFTSGKTRIGGVAGMTLNLLTELNAKKETPVSLSTLATTVLGSDTPENRERISNELSGSRRRLISSGLSIHSTRKSQGVGREFGYFLEQTDNPDSSIETPPKREKRPDTYSEGEVEFSGVRAAIIHKVLELGSASKPVTAEVLALEIYGDSSKVFQDRIFREVSNIRTMSKGTVYIKNRKYNDSHPERPYGYYLETNTSEEGATSIASEYPQLSKREQQFIDILHAHPQGVGIQEIQKLMGTHTNASELAKKIRAKNPIYSELLPDRAGKYTKWFLPGHLRVTDSITRENQPESDNQTSQGSNKTVKEKYTRIQYVTKQQRRFLEVIRDNPGITGEVLTHLVGSSVYPADIAASLREQYPEIFGDLYATAKNRYGTWTLSESMAAWIGETPTETRVVPEEGPLPTETRTLQKNVLSPEQTHTLNSVATEEIDTFLAKNPSLSETEIKIIRGLNELLTQNGAPVNVEELAQKVYGEVTPNSKKNIQRRIYDIRNKIGESSFSIKHVSSVRGKPDQAFGYFFEKPTEELTPEEPIQKDDEPQALLSEEPTGKRVRKGSYLPSTITDESRHKALLMLISDDAVPLSDILAAIGTMKGDRKMGWQHLIASFHTLTRTIRARARENIASPEELKVAALIDDLMERHQITTQEDLNTLLTLIVRERSNQSKQVIITPESTQGVLFTATIEPNNAEDFDDNLNWSRERWNEENKKENGHTQDSLEVTTEPEKSDKPPVEKLSYTDSPVYKDLNTNQKGALENFIRQNFPIEQFDSTIQQVIDDLNMNRSILDNANWDYADGQPTAKFNRYMRKLLHLKRSFQKTPKPIV